MQMSIHQLASTEVSFGTRTFASLLELIECELNSISRFDTWRSSSSAYRVSSCWLSPLVEPECLAPAGAGTNC